MRTLSLMIASATDGGNSISVDQAIDIQTLYDLLADALASVASEKSASESSIKTDEPKPMEYNPMKHGVPYWALVKYGSRRGYEEAIANGEATRQ